MFVYEYVCSVYASSYFMKFSDLLPCEDFLEVYVFPIDYRMPIDQLELSIDIY